MYTILHQLLMDKKSDVIFACFGTWHLLYMAVIFLVIWGLLLWLRKKPTEIRQRAADRAICFAFGLYTVDFFLMPFAYGTMDLEKLPFHVCTAMCVLCFIARRSPLLQKYRLSLTVLALASNLIYTIYPAGVGWHQIHPLSYRVIQTLLFHGSMTTYGVLYLTATKLPMPWKVQKNDLQVIAAMTFWAMLGNYLYNGSADGYDHFFNWFFVVRDPFYLLPEHIAPYIMPFVMIAVMYVAMTLIYGGWFFIRKWIKR